MVKFHSDHGFSAGVDRVSIMEHYSPDFPRLLYKSNGAVAPKDDDGAQAYERNLIRGRAVDTLTVMNASQQDSAIADGWFMTPEETDQDEASQPATRGPGRPRREA